MGCISLLCFTERHWQISFKCHTIRMQFVSEFFFFFLGIYKLLTWILQDRLPESQSPPSLMSLIKTSYSQNDDYTRPAILGFGERIQSHSLSPWVWHLGRGLKGLWRKRTCFGWLARGWRETVDQKPSFRSFGENKSGWQGGSVLRLNRDPVA